MTNQAQQEMDEALDKLEGELPEELETEVVEEEVELVDNKHVHMSYQEWIDDGRDPDDYRGKNAFDSYGKLLAQTEQNGNQLKEAISGINDWKKTQEAENQAKLKIAIAEATARLDKAKEDEDVEAALAARDEISELNKAPSAEPAAQQLNPVVAGFIRKNPILDESSAQYDREFFADVSMVYDSNIDVLTGGNPARHAALTEQQMERALTLAMRKAKELNPDKVKSPRNARKAAPAAREKAPVSTNYEARLKGYGGGGLNKNDTNPALDTYLTIKAMNPAQAEVYAKNLLGE
jgi:hypothetical protein